LLEVLHDVNRLRHLRLLHLFRHLGLLTHLLRRLFHLIFHAQLLLLFIHLHLRPDLLVKLLLIVCIEGLYHLFLTILGGSGNLPLDVLLKVAVQLGLEQRLQLGIGLALRLWTFIQLLVGHGLGLWLAIYGVDWADLGLTRLVQTLHWLLLLLHVFEGLLSLFGILHLIPIDAI
jgi:hypothetical protein